MRKNQVKTLLRLPNNVQSNGAFKLEKIGVNEFDVRDPYHLALAISWPQFFMGVVLVYLAINLVFALLYLAVPGSVIHMPAGSLPDAFFFSIETLATVGYGNMAPVGLYAHVVSTVEIFIGMLLTATMTGLVFVRFSKPQSKILFAEKAVVTRSGGRTRLMIRIGNGRMYALTDAEARLTTIVSETEPNGQVIRYVVDLKLQLTNMAFFPLTWLVIHEVTQDSPLQLLLTTNKEELLASQMRFMLSVTARDPSLSAQVYAAQAYTAADVALDHRYADAVTGVHTHHAVADMRKISDTEPDSAEAPTL